MKNTEEYGIIIVGAGPSGIGAAIELLRYGYDGRKILMVEMGPDLNLRIQSRLSGDDKYVTTGFGGAGLFSDGKLYYARDDLKLFPDDEVISRMWEAMPNHEIDEGTTIRLYKKAYSFLEGVDISIKQQDIDFDKLEKLKYKFKENGVHFYFYESRQFEPTHLPKILKNHYKNLIESGVKILFGTKFISYETDNINNFNVFCEKNGGTPLHIKSKYLILGMGKSGMKWFNENKDRTVITHKERPYEIGVRVEVPKSVLSPYTSIHRDLQLINKINKDTMVQTFCTCTGGKISTCQYEDFSVLGGYTDDNVTDNANFALLVKMMPKNKEYLKFAISIIETANLLSNRKPIVQRLGDLKNSRASTIDDITDNPLKTTIEDYYAGDIGMAFPRFIIEALLSTLEKYSKTIQGLYDDYNIISAPCLELCYKSVRVDKYMETECKNLFIVGDAAGYDNGIISSLASGILSAQGIAEKDRLEYTTLVN